MSGFLFVAGFLGLGLSGAPHPTPACANNVAVLDREYQAAVASKDAAAIDRILPFDCIPRIITAAEWAHLERGVKQRVAAYRWEPEGTAPYVSAHT